MILEVQNLQKSFGEKRVLEGVTFSAQQGKAVGLLGRNGAGKTTTIRIAMDVFPADGGAVLWNGKPLRQGMVPIGYLPEEHGLYPRLVVRDQLVYLAALRGMPRKEAKASIEHWFSRLAISEYLPRKLDTLSKGNQQKVQLATALIANPSLIILDEPFSGLDPVNAALLKDVVKELIADGRVVLFSSHQMSYVEEFCDSIAILHQGTIAVAGEIAAIKRSYDRRLMLVKTTNPAGVQAFCAERLAGLVLSAKLLPTGLQLQLDDAAHKGELMAALGGSGLDVDLVAVYEPSLNDIFVQYTGDADEEANGGQAV